MKRHKATIHDYAGMEATNIYNALRAAGFAFTGSGEQTTFLRPVHLPEVEGSVRVEQHGDGSATFVQEIE